MCILYDVGVAYTIVLYVQYGCVYVYGTVWEGWHSVDCGCKISCGCALTGEQQVVKAVRQSNSQTVEQLSS